MTILKNFPIKNVLILKIQKRLMDPIVLLYTQLLRQIWSASNFFDGLLKSIPQGF